MTAHTDRVKSVRDAVAATVTGATLDKGERVLLATGDLADFRCCYGLRRLDGGSVAIDARSAKLLRAGQRDRVWSIER
jgi:arginine N-succinyltransferase